MNNAELIDSVAAVTGLKKKDVKATLAATSEAVAVALKNGGSVVFAGLGRFAVTRQAARHILHPRTRDRMLIAAKKKPRFSPSVSLETIVGGF